MKKILSLGVAAAVVSMTAVAASAAIEPVILDEAVAGSTITVEVVVNGDAIEDAQFTVETSDNLELVEATPDASGVYNEGKFACASMTGYEDGAVLLTLVYTVGEGDEVSVELKSDDATYAAMLGEAVTAEIVDGSEDLPPVVEPDDPGDIIEPGTDEPGTDEPSTDEPSTGDEGNVPTGIALAVAPAVIAGAAIVVSKKRK